VAQPFNQLVDDLFIRRGEPEGLLGQHCRRGLLLGILDHVEQHLGGAQIGRRRFVDQLSDDGLAHGDREALTVLGTTTGLFSPSTSNAIRFFAGRPRGLAEGSPLFEARVPRRLAVAPPATRPFALPPSICKKLFPLDAARC
jgi:hypothetical protein